MYPRSLSLWTYKDRSKFGQIYAILLPHGGLSQWGWSNRPRIRPGTVKSLNAPWELSYCTIASGQYMLLSGRPVQIGQVPFKFKFTTRIEWPRLCDRVARRVLILCSSTKKKNLPFSNITRSRPRSSFTIELTREKKYLSGFILVIQTICSSH